MKQLKKVSLAVDDAIKTCNNTRLELETERSEALKEIGNMVHESVPVSNDEVKFYVRMVGVKISHKKLKKKMWTKECSKCMTIRNEFLLI